jgi:hypothetical protein
VKKEIGQDWFTICMLSISLNKIHFRRVSYSRLVFRRLRLSNLSIEAALPFVAYMFVVSFRIYKSSYFTIDCVLKKKRGNSEELPQKVTLY